MIPQKKDDELPTPPPDSAKRQSARNSPETQQGEASRNNPALYSLLEKLFESSQRPLADASTRSRYSQRQIDQPAEQLETVRDEEQSHGHNAGNEQATEPPQVKERIMIQEDLAKLASMLGPRNSTAEAWNMFLELPSFRNRTLSADSTALLGKSRVVKDLLAQVFTNFLTKVNHLTPTENASSDGTPSLATVFEEYSRRGLLRPKLASQHVRGLVLKVLNVLDRIESNDKNSKAQSMEQVCMLLDQTLHLWRIHFSERGSDVILETSPHSTSDRQFDGLPPIEAIKAQLDNCPKHFTFIARYSAVLSNYYPSTVYHTNYLKHQFAVSAGLTWLALHMAKERSLLSPDLMSRSEHFYEVFGLMNSGRSHSLGQFQQYMSKTELDPQVYDRLNTAWELAMKGFRDATWQSTRGDEQNSKGDPAMPWYTFRADEEHRNAFTNDVRSVGKNRDHKGMLKFWKTFTETARPKRLQGYLEILLAEFLWGFVNIGDVHGTIEVWETMKGMNIRPTLNHWGPMLHICGKRRDHISLENMWENLRTSGIIPDNHTWSIYIWGLLRSHRWKDSIRTLKELGKAWDANIAKQKSGVAIASGHLPDIITVNVAISGLTQCMKQDAAQTVFDWALSKGIKPSVETFNIFLKTASRKSQYHDISRILEQMGQYSCVPDSFTFNILIDGGLRRPDAQFHLEPPERQQEVVLDIYDKMFEARIPPTNHTYTSLLASLLFKSDNMTAARALLSRMAADGVKPTASIYLLLVGYYFNTKPPDLASIDALWRRIHEDGTQMSHMFYDRMIEGYAKCGEMEKMLQVLRKVPKMGVAPGWIALYRAVEVLNENNELELCTKLVQDIERSGGLLRMGTSGWKGEKEFWALVQDLRRNGRIPEQL